MCGICGVAYSDRSRLCAADRVIAMREALAHRGPDGAGVITFGPIGLGHRRLSIIDVARGHQPLSNEDESVWVVFNGEIYNYQHLTRELSGSGHRFRTLSDTEVLVHAYEEWGDEFVTRLNGMFAFALYDKRRDRLLLVRDHLGIKPIFFEETAEGLFFGSEIKAVLAGSGRSRRVQPDAIPEYLVFRYLAWDRSFFSGVRRVPPGHMAVWEGGRLAIRPYWSPGDFAPCAVRSLEDAVEELDSLLTSAVRSQLMSEVPLGVFCSGGVDSGLVTRLAAREVPPPLHSFSVGFVDPAWDESSLARDTAQRAGAEHHVITCRPGEVGDLVPMLLRFHDEPLSHPNSVPLAVLSRFARERVTVVLTGEGPDEVLSGYPRHHIAQVRERLDGLPSWAVRLIGRLVGWLPARRLHLVGELLRPTLEESIVLNSRYVALSGVARLMGESVEGVIGVRRELARRMLVDGDGISSINRYELVTYLQCALDRMDRMSMAWGLEARVPFLDVRLVEWGLRLPSKLKVGGTANKLVLKALAERYLSEEITRGRKSGFGLPLDAWFRGPELGALLRPLHQANHPAASHFRFPVVKQLLAEHEAGRRNHGEVLWLLANVYQWYEVQIVNGGATPAAA